MMFAPFHSIFISHKKIFRPCHPPPQAFFFNFPLHKEAKLFSSTTNSPKCDTLSSESSSSCSLTITHRKATKTLPEENGSARLSALLFDFSVVIYIARYTFIFPIIILLSFTRRRSRGVRAGHRKFHQWILQLRKIISMGSAGLVEWWSEEGSPFALASAIGRGWAEINDIDNNYRFVLEHFESSRAIKAANISPTNCDARMSGREEKARALPAALKRGSRHSLRHEGDGIEVVYHRAH